LIFDLSSIPVTSYRKGEIPLKSGVYISEGSDFLEVWQDATFANIPGVIPFAWVRKDIPGLTNSLSFTVNELNSYWNPSDDFETFEITKSVETFH